MTEFKPSGGTQTEADGLVGDATRTKLSRSTSADSLHVWGSAAAGSNVRAACARIATLSVDELGALNRHLIKIHKEYLTRKNYLGGLGPTAPTDVEANLSQGFPQGGRDALEAPHDHRLGGLLGEEHETLLRHDAQRKDPNLYPALDRK